MSKLSKAYKDFYNIIGGYVNDKGEFKAKKVNESVEKENRKMDDQMRKKINEEYT